MKVTVCAFTTFILFCFNFFFFFSFLSRHRQDVAVETVMWRSHRLPWTTAGQDQTAAVSADTEASGSSHKLLVQPLRAADAGCQSVGVSCQTTLCQLQLSLLTLQNMEEELEKKLRKTANFFSSIKKFTRWANVWKNLANATIRYNSFHKQQYN